MITRYAPGGAVAAANHLAAAAGAVMLDRGGNAVDAVIATAAAMAVTAPHMCGLGGDLFALVATAGAAPAALNASGRAGSGADAQRLRAQGARRMPFQGEIASVTLPGCVDGLVALQERFATLPLEDLLGPARRLAHDGFPVSPTLAHESHGAGRRPASTSVRQFRGVEHRPPSAPPGGGWRVGAVGHGRPRRLLRGRRRIRAAGARRRPVHRRGSRRTPGRLGRLAVA